MDRESGTPAADFSSGMSPDSDPALVRQPQGQPGFGENHAFWISSGDVQIWVHLNTLEGAGAFDLRHGAIRVLLPNGRCLTSGEDGGPTLETVASSGNLHFQCDAPFERWTCRFRGVMRDVSLAGQLQNGPMTIVDFEVAATMAAPAWINGAFTPGGLGPVSAFMGGHRYEQLFRCTGRVRIGEQEIAIDGQGNRTHRRGVRAYGPMLGHCWGAGMFPSGAGFGYQIYPTEDGGVLWDEGYLVEDGRLVAARVTAAPWLDSFHTVGKIASTQLDTGERRMTIEGKIIGSSIFMMVPGRIPPDDVIIAQCWVRYSCNGEVAYNMLERSLRRSEINKAR
jgi:hypothetical protein